VSPKIFTILLWLLKPVTDTTGARRLLTFTKLQSYTQNTTFLNIKQDPVDATAEKYVQTCQHLEK